MCLFANFVYLDIRRNYIVILLFLLVRIIHGMFHSDVVYSCIYIYLQFYRNIIMMHNYYYDI